MSFYVQGPRPLSGLLGEALGQGVARNFPSPELLAQRRMQQGALEQFKSSLEGGETPAQITEKWLSAFGGVPGAEQYNPLLQQSILGGILGYNAQAPNAMGSGGQQMPQAAQQGLPPSQMPGQGGIAPPVQSQGGGLAPPVQGVGVMQQPQGGVQQPQGATQGSQMQGGFDPRIAMLSQSLGMPYEEVQQMMAGLPQERIASELQQQQLGRSEALANYATQKLAKGNTAPNQEDVNDFMRVGQKYQNLPPEEWFKSTKRDYDKFVNAKNSFDRANIPGILSGMYRGNQYREDAINNLQKIAKPLVKIGEENFVRSRLADLGLSPTEIESVVKPLPKEITNGIKGLPKAVGSNYSEDVAQDPNLQMKENKKYVNWIQKNLGDQSLLMMREQFKRQKNMNWRQFQDVIEEAQNQGLELNPDQLNEQGELTYAPRDSLLDIFQDYGRIIDWVRGAR